MAETTRPTDYPVIQELFAHPKRFTFYQAVRLLECCVAGPRVGHQGPARSEALRFRSSASLAFPTAELDGIDERDNDGREPPIRYLLTCSFLGIYGPTSPLPAAYSEYLVRPEDIGDEEDRERLRAFLDLYNHRLISLFYRSLSKYRYHMLFAPGGTDRFSHFMYSLIGRGTAGMPADRPVPAVSMLRYAGLLTQQPKSAAGLRGILADYFGAIAVRIEQCAGRWLRVEDTNAIGKRFCSLGQDAIVGAKVYDRTGKFRISLGPVSLAQFMDLLPTGSRIGELRELVRLYLLDELDFDVEIWLRGDEVPPTKLGDESQPALLGWTSWAIEGPGEDRSVIFAAAG